MLPKTVQGELADALERLLQSALPPKGKSAECAWFKKLHQLIDINLEAELAPILQKHNVPWFPVVHSALVHASPFFVRATKSLGPSVEIGDMLVVSTYSLNHVFRREALLLQLKIGKGTRNNAHTKTWNSTRRQAELYAGWPEFDWTAPSMKNLLSGSRVGTVTRRPVHAPCRAAQFAFIPPYGLTSPGSGFWAREVMPLTTTPPVYFRTKRELAHEWASVLRLDLGVDATPTRSRSMGWSQIIEDMLYATWQITRSGVRNVHATAGGFLNRLTVPHLFAQAMPPEPDMSYLPDIRPGEPMMQVTHVGFYDQAMYHELKPKDPSA